MEVDRVTAVIQDQLHWLHQWRIQCKVCAGVQVLHGAATVYLAEMCTPVSSSVNQSHLRFEAHGNLTVHCFRTSRYGQRSFAVSRSTLWNTVPATYDDPSMTPTQFCALVKTVLFSRTYEHYRSVSVRSVRSCHENINPLTYNIVKLTKNG